MSQRTRARVTTAFFSHFFELVVVAISLAQALMLWWIFPPVHMSWGVIRCVTLAAVLYTLNRRLIRWTMHRRQRGARIGAIPRTYFAAALTCLFCIAYLGALVIAWIPITVFLEAIAVEARPTLSPLVATGLHPAFLWLADAGMTAIALAFTYGYTVGQRRLRVRRFELPLRDLPGALDGLRIVQISDIHLGENITAEQLDRFVSRVNALQPNLICITGDIVDSPYADVDFLLPRLARLHATSGVFAILGNHDHYAGADEVVAKLNALTNFTVLRDTHTTIEVNGHRVYIVGLDDRGRDWARGVPAVAYLGETLPALPNDGPVIVLCHRPDIFPQAAAGGAALTLSGHTHGGQLGIPWLNGRVRNLAEFITPFDRGLFDRDGSYLYVNCGLGVTAQRIRLCTPREITVIEARSRRPEARDTLH